MRIVILGAAGRDFHNFNIVYRDDPASEVVAFTAAQIPGIAGRRYPPALAGPLLPATASRSARRAGSTHPVASAGGWTGRLRLQRRQPRDGDAPRLAGPRGRRGLPAARPPQRRCSLAPAGDRGLRRAHRLRQVADDALARGAACARAACASPSSATRCPTATSSARRRSVSPRWPTSDRAGCTLEEREEYEPHIAPATSCMPASTTRRVLRAGRGGGRRHALGWRQQRLPLHPPRPSRRARRCRCAPGDESGYSPRRGGAAHGRHRRGRQGECGTGRDVGQVAANVRRSRPDGRSCAAASPVTLDDPTAVRGRRVLVVEDGPTLTHGGMAYGAGYVAAAHAPAPARSSIRGPSPPGRSPRSIAAYPQLGPVLPAMGYDETQLRGAGGDHRALRCRGRGRRDTGRPGRVGPATKPVVRARYELAELEAPGLAGHVTAFLARRNVAGG